tara:strand:- start:92024 stop:98293 length:6270 start_codon:yes stop_codon:yes gene_type:complete
MTSDPIAITGISCRFPGNICDTDTFWEFIVAGKDAIRPIPANRKSLSSLWSEIDDIPNYGGFIDNIEHFDAAFFGISPREARFIDPQQRILLELAWEALEDGGSPPNLLRGKNVGVYTGIYLDEYWDLQRYLIPDRLGIHTNTGGALSIAANRISYFLDLKGPSISVDTACSSSLTAIHLACQDIRSGLIDTALAGGVNLILNPQTSKGFQHAQMLSLDGKCKAFDKNATGYGRSDGGAIVVLKSLKKALVDGDFIYSLIHGSAINQDGYTKTLTYPNQKSQETVIETALRIGNINPKDIFFVEAHGTGTPTGDPIEARAIGKVVGPGGCLIGSVKTNIGHTEAASGVAGIIKAALALKNGLLPRSIHVNHPNPKIPFGKLGLKIVRRTKVLPDGVYGGVNSFGFGGANAHVVLGPPPRNPESLVFNQFPNSQKLQVDNNNYKTKNSYPIDSQNSQIFMLSSRNPTTLRQKAMLTADQIKRSPNISSYDIGSSHALRRSHLESRLAVVFQKKSELGDILETFGKGKYPDKLEIGGGDQKPLIPVFIFTGMGPQWYGMGDRLYKTVPAFRNKMEKIDNLFIKLGSPSIIDAIMNGNRGTQITDIETAQAGNLLIQYAIADWWRKIGVKPEIIIGHSVGEISAAYEAGILKLEDAVKIIYERTRLQKKFVGSGEMLAVGISAEAIQPLIKPFNDISIAAINSSVSVTLSGSKPSIEKIRKILIKKNYFYKNLNTNIAYHSDQMDVIKNDFIKSLDGLSLNKNKKPFYSTVTGNKIIGTDLTPDYWWANLREPVYFNKVFKNLSKEMNYVFIQIGPQPVLSIPIVENLSHFNLSGEILPSMLRNDDQWKVLLESASKCHVNGLNLKWSQIYNNPSVKFPMVAYPWEKQKFWLENHTSQPNINLPNKFLGKGFESSVDPDSCLWEGSISLTTHPILSKHNIKGRTIMPLAGQIQFLLETLPKNELGVIFNNVEIVNPIVFNRPETLKIQVVRKNNKYVIASKPCSDRQRNLTWLSNLYAERAGHDIRNIKNDLGKIRKICQSNMTGDKFYEDLYKRGYDYGPQFRHIKKIIYSEKEILADLSVQDLNDFGDKFHLGILDSCFQLLILICPQNKQYLPVAIESFMLHRYPGPKQVMLVYAKRREHLANGKELADVFLVDEEGSSLISFVGVTLATSNNSDSETNYKNDDLFYEEKWILEPLPEPKKERGNKKYWYILTANQKLGFQLAKILNINGESGEFVNICDLTNRMDENKISKILSSDNGKNKELGIITIWTGKEKIDNQTELAEESFRLIRAVLKNLNLSISLHFCTLGANSVIPTDIVSPDATAIWGSGRVFMREHPEIDFSLIDLPQKPDSTDLKYLVNSLGMDKAPQEIAIRNKEKFARRLVGLKLQKYPLKEFRTPRPKSGNFRLFQNQTGSLETLHFRNCQTPKLEANEVTIRVRATALNYRDILTALGMLKNSGNTLYGWEYVGEVIAKGPLVTTINIGDLVVGIKSGCMANILNTNTDLIVPIPNETHIENIITIPIAFLTAYWGLYKKGEMSSGDKVLIHNATGGVGLAAIQLANKIGAEIFATAGSSEKREYLVSLGIKNVMDSRTLDFAEEVMEKTNGQGVDIILNTLTSQGMKASMSVLADYGRFIEIGKIGLLENDFIDLKYFDQNKSYHPIDLSQIIKEKPDRVRKVLEKIINMFSEGTIKPLPYKSYSLGDARNAFRFMAQARHIGKLLLLDDDKLIPCQLSDNQTAIRPGGKYLITGGGGGIGEILIRWLLERKAGSVIITGRRKRNFLKLKKSDQLKIKYVQVDVTDQQKMQHLISDINEKNNPLRGVFHAAGILDDGIFLTVNSARFERVLRPKIIGCRNLHEITKNIDLDLFVLFSSVSSLAGIPGQGSYAAANAYLDGMADYRRLNKQPVTTINWGPWQNIGMMANPRLSDYLEKQGFKLITPEKAGIWLDAILRRSVYRVAVMPRQEGKNDNNLTNLLGLEHSRQPSGLANLKTIGNDIQQIPVAQLRYIIQNCLIDGIVKIVEMEPKNIEMTDTWQALGIDSLMAVELRNWIEEGLGLSISVDRFQSESSIAETSEIILSTLKATSRI